MIYSNRAWVWLHAVPVVIWRRLVPPARVERVGVADADSLDVERVQPDRAALGHGEAVVVVGLGAGADRACVYVNEGMSIRPIYWAYIPGYVTYRMQQQATAASPP